MPELFFDIKFRADESSKRTIKDDLNEMQRQADSASQGSTESTQKQTQATQKQANAEKELLKEFQRKVTLNEVQFRQGKLTQKQAIESANAIESQAIEQGILTNETLQGVRAQKTMFLSQQRIQTGFTGMSQTSARANQSLINLGRIVQDLPFGFLGISNNIDPALTSLRSLKDESGGAGGAFKALLGSLKGPGGIIFALGSLLPTAVLIAQRGFNFYSKQTSEAADSTKELSDEIIKLTTGETGALNLASINQAAVRAEQLAQAYQEYADVINSGALEDESERLFEQAQLSREKAEATVQALAASSELSERQVRDNLTLMQRNDISLEQQEIFRESLQLKIDESERNVKLLNQEEVRVDRTNKILSEYEKQKDVLSDILRQVQDEARLKLQQIDAQKELGLLTKSEFKLREREILNEIATTRDRYILELDQIEEAKNARIEAQFEVWENRKKLQQEMIENMPEAEDVFGVDESRGLAASALIDSMRTDIAISQAEGLAQKRLEIEKKFQRERIEIIKQFGTEAQSVKELLRLLDVQREQEIERAKTQVTKEGERERSDIRQKALDQAFASASTFISSLMKLNQAQSDQSEAQARKRFETQKKLAIAQAIVDGAAAAVKTWKNMGGFPTAIPFVAAQVAATATQIAAIRRTQFESGGSQDSSIPSEKSASEEQPRGFFITDVNEEPVFPLRPFDKQDQQVVINVENRLDKEGLALYVKQGNERVSSRNFTVISNG